MKENKKQYISSTKVGSRIFGERYKSVSNES